MGAAEGPDQGAARPVAKLGETITIDRLTHHDIPVVCALYKRVWEGQRSDLPPELLKTLEPTPLEFTSAMEGVTYFAARRDGRPVGAIGLELENGSAHIVSLVVDPELRRQGIGRALAQAAVEWSRHAGERMIWADPLAKFTAAAALFHSLGFVQAGTLHRRLWGEDVVLFEMLL